MSARAARHSGDSPRPSPWRFRHEDDVRKRRLAAAWLLNEPVVRLNVGARVAGLDFQWLAQHQQQQTGSCDATSHSANLMNGAGRGDAAHIGLLLQQ
jgi:hypothetical protein